MLLYFPPKDHRLFTQKNVYGMACGDTNKQPSSEGKILKDYNSKSWIIALRWHF